ncbi:MAG: bifunctional alpha,alpha-trehalose-phosphate synthase (UDP-forming)/trehalose-phosphatase [Cyclobacteriaceae bacterium]|nr:bifunctional alpha,alpha-trehalose-phosphate synthase (UDP-forming)/trehalose-phosphatase [Cyclobacteriaceae bacterium]
MSKVIIVSNRLPVKIVKEKNKLSYQPSEGGLATGLGSIYKEGNNLWIGWPGVELKKESEQHEVREEIRKENMAPVFLTRQEVEVFYEGFSNATLWPLFHYFHQFAIYDQKLFDGYKAVNDKYCEIVVEKAQPGDIIWVHDYQLLLLPQMIRARLPGISIGFFLHIPFPSFEAFRLLPWRREILMGMLGSDLIGFHTYDDMRHFLSSVSRIAGISASKGVITVESRSVEVDSFPMGIDYQKYHDVASSPETIKREIDYRTSLGKHKLILSIDRLDYSKGIPQRLYALDKFFEKYPEFIGIVSQIMIVVPSRDNVGEYKRLKEEIDLLVGRINGKYGTIHWTPIHYFYRSFSLYSLSAFYRMADVALVTPMRDGMNLVCKEFIASKLDQKGVLILSEMAGASKELSDAILINPNDIDQMVNALHEALIMPPEDQIAHIKIMQESLKRYNIHHWVKIFFDRLNDVITRQKFLATKVLDPHMIRVIREKYDKAKKRILFLDYDGTLTGFHDQPQKAKPDKDLVDILDRLSRDKKNTVVIISGRDRRTLEEWVGYLDMDIIAEHGIWIREKNKDWETFTHLKNDWKSDFRPIFENYVDRTPGSFIEEKDYSLVWHYRKVETGLGELRTRELASHLRYMASDKNLSVLEGDMVIEIKNSEVDNGRASERWLQHGQYEFILAIGDDWTDEDTFLAMPDDAITIRVGRSSSQAKYRIDSFNAVRDFFKELL